MSKIDVSIIIVSWNVRHFIEGCLLSLSSNRRFVYEIIVVDNNSQDNTGEYIKGKWPDIILIENQENFGFARANNQGIRTAQGRYIVLLNPDTRVVGNAVDKLVDFMDSHADVGLGGGKLLNPQGTLQPSLRNFPNPIRDFLYTSGLTALFRLIKDKIYSAQHLASNNHDKWRYHQGYINGAFLIIRKNILDKIGMFDERYPLYFEETDLCYRFLQRGFRTAYVPNAKVIHYGGQSTLQLGAASHSLYFRSLFMYYKKYGGLGQVRRAKLAVFIGAMVRFFILLLKFTRGSKTFIQHFNTCYEIARTACSSDADHTISYYLKRIV